MRHAILTSHGTDNPVGAAVISDLVAAVQSALPGVRVHETYVDVQHPQLPEVLTRELAADPTGEFVVVPLLLGTGYHVKQDMADAVLQALTQHPSANIALVRAFQAAPELVNLMVSRVLEYQPLASDIVLFATAGSSDAASRDQAAETFELFSLALAKQAPGTKAELAYLSAAEPRLKDLVPRLKFKNPRSRIIVATHLLAPGFFFDLIKKSGAHLISEPLLSATEPTPSGLVELVIKRIAEALDQSQTLGCAKPADTNWNCVAGCAKVCR